MKPSVIFIGLLIMTLSGCANIITERCIDYERHFVFNTGFDRLPVKCEVKKETK